MRITLPRGSHISWYMATSQKAFLAALLPHMKRLPRRVKEEPCTRRYLDQHTVAHYQFYWS